MEQVFRARLWKYEGEAAWFFVTLPAGVASAVREWALPGKAFGTVRVVATIGDTRWKTSVFPDRKRGSYLLPVKAAVRERESLVDGMTIEVVLDQALR